jgi:hypothetical protein
VHFVELKPRQLDRLSVDIAKPVDGMILESGITCPGASGVSRTVPICPTGCFAISVSSPNCKNIFLLACPKSNLEPAPSRPTEGRLAIVTDAGRDAMDADVLPTNST